MFAAIHCNYCPSIWPTKATQQHSGPSTVMHTFPYKAQTWKLLIFASKQCINSYETGSKTAMHEFSVPSVQATFWRQQCVKEGRYCCKASNWCCYKQTESRPKNQAQISNKTAETKSWAKWFKHFCSGFTLQCTKANFSLPKLSKIVICRSSSSCYLVWEVSGIRTKFSHSKNETQQGKGTDPTAEKKRSKYLYTLLLLMQLTEDAKVCKEPNKGKKGKRVFTGPHSSSV